MKIENILSARLLLIICLTIICFHVGNDEILGQKVNLKERLSAQREKIQVSSLITAQKICSNGDMKLNVSITVKNLSDTPIVFCADCMTDVAVFVSRDTNLLYQDKFVYDLDSFGAGSKFTLPNPLPFEKPFVTLKSNESFTFEVEPYFYNSNERGAVLEPNDYVFVQVINTWSDTTDLSVELKNQWKNKGLLFWTNSLITEPISLKVKKTAWVNCQN